MKKGGERRGLGRVGKIDRHTDRWIEGRTLVL